MILPASAVILYNVCPYGFSCLFLKPAFMVMSLNTTIYIVWQQLNKLNKINLFFWPSSNPVQNIQHTYTHAYIQNHYGLFFV